MIPGTHKDIINQQNLTSKFRFVLLYLRRWHVPLRFRLTVRVFPSLGHRRLLGRKCNSNAGSIRKYQQYDYQAHYSLTCPKTAQPEGELELLGRTATGAAGL